MGFAVSRFAVAVAEALWSGTVRSGDGVALGGEADGVIFGTVDGVVVGSGVVVGDGLGDGDCVGLGVGVAGVDGDGVALVDSFTAASSAAALSAAVLSAAALSFAACPSKAANPGIVK